MRRTWYEAKAGMRRALRFETARQIASGFAHAWKQSDPLWAERLMQRIAEHEDEWRTAATGQRARARERLAAQDWTATYEGEVEVRAALRGIHLAELADSPELGDWLSESLGLNDWSGETARLRISATLLDTDRPDVSDDR
jgi:hypothetical protein